jgi:hypothetical protein
MHVHLIHKKELTPGSPEQGRITKVINMSPQEILGLIAEAAGTKVKKKRAHTFSSSSSSSSSSDQLYRRMLPRHVSWILVSARLSTARS